MSAKNTIPPSAFTTTLLLVILLLFLFNFNLDIFNAGAAPEQIYGEGAPGFIPKWVMPTIPSASSLTVNVSNSNYCGSGIHATVNWTYSDPGGSPQSAYEVQIDDDADPLSGQPEWESGIVSSSGTSAATTLCNTANPIASPQTACRMTWNTIYRAWARVRNIVNQWSPWILMDTYINSGVCSGAGCVPPGAPVTSWTTPVHAFPDVDPPFGTGGCAPSGNDFSWTPCSPSVGSPIQFTDRTNFAAGSINREWVWSFTGGSPVSSNIQTPLPVTYSAFGSYSVIESVRDDAMPAGAYCTVTKNVSLQTALPRWREVAPR